MTGDAIVVQGNAINLPLEDESVDLIITSPPYFALRSYRDEGEHYAGQIGSEETPQAFLEALWAATREMVRVLKPTGSIWVNLGDSYSRGQRLDSEFTFEDAAWLAGVVDSDGSISAYYRTDRSSPQHGVFLEVGQKDRQVVDRAALVTGLGTVKRDEGRGMWRWRLSDRSAGWVLERIWPWLFIKRRQAFAAVELISSKQGVGGTGGLRSKLDAPTLAYRDRLRAAITAWNHGESDDYEPALLPLPDLPRSARWLREKSLMMLPARYAIGCIDDLGLILRAEVIWSKPNGLPESVTDRVRRSHEQWFHFVREPRYFAAVDEVREPQLMTGGQGRSARSAVAADNYLRKDERPTHDGKARGTFKVTEFAFNPLGKLPGSVWNIPSEPLLVPQWARDKLNLPDHFAAFPQEWPRRIILGWSPSGVCVECGEGRRPVVEKELDRTQGYSGTDRLTRNTDNRFARAFRTERGIGRTMATITGYACACTPREPETKPAVVLDPFGGTGTVAMVARTLGRTGISVDLSHDYSRLAKWRIWESGHSAKTVRKTWNERQGNLL